MSVALASSRPCPVFLLITDTKRVLDFVGMGHERRSGLFPAMSGLPPNSRHVNERWISSVWAQKPT